MTKTEPVKLKKKGLWARIWENRTLYLFISPFFILFFVFGIYPIIYNIYLSMIKWDGIGEMVFVGAQNFITAFQDTKMWNSILNTGIIWVLSTIPMIILALIIAFLLNSKHFVKYEFLKTVFYLPNVTSLVAVAVIFSTIFGTQSGIINYLLGLIGVKSIAWTTDQFFVKLVLAIMVIWRWTGYNAIILLAGLQKISPDLYEAAEIDGANGWHIFSKITIPLLNPIIVFVVMTSTIGGLQLFTEPQVLLGNQGGTGQAGMTISLYLYKEAFISYNFGYSAAISWILFVIVVFFSFLNMRITSRSDK